MTLAAAGEFTQGVTLKLLLILAAAGVVSLVLGRLRIAAIPAYLIAGLLLGLVVPTGEGLDAISGMAIVLLMFSVGLHMDIASLRRGALPILLAGAISTLVSTLILWPLAMTLGLDWRGALAAGMALSLSSTAVVLRVLQQRRELHRVQGRVALGILIIQDLAVIAMLALIPLLGTPDLAQQAVETVTEPQEATSALANALMAVGGMGAFIFGGSILLPRLMRAAATVTQEVTLVVAAAVVLSAAILSDVLNLSPELGAFLAGFLLASTPFRYQLAGQLAPLRDLLMAVFFVAVGLGADLPEMVVNLRDLALFTLALLVVKAIVIAATCWAVGASAAVAGATGASLAQAGEFSLVVLAVAIDQGIIGERGQAVLLGTVILSLILTPALVGSGRHIGAWLTSRVPIAPWAHSRALREPGERDGAPAEQGPARPVVIVAGFGPVGRAAVERLEQMRVEIRIIELNPETVRRQRELGRCAHFGDATNPDVLEAAGIDSADAVIVTIPDDEAMLRACRIVRELNSDVCLAVRASGPRRGMTARQLGANFVAVEELATAETMARGVLEEIAPLISPDNVPAERGRLSATREAEP